MQDNGLLSYYKQQKAKGEFLSTKTLPISSVQDELEEVVKLNIQTPQNKIVKYYLKPAGSLERTTEILLSQIYAKAGLDTSTYLPILDGDVIKIISEDANQGNTALAKDFVNNHGFFAFSNIKGSESFKKNSAKPINGLDISSSAMVNNQHYLPSVIRQLILTRYLDTASFNDDRHLGNFFYMYSSVAKENASQPTEGSLGLIQNPSIILPNNHKVSSIVRGIALAKQGLDNKKVQEALNGETLLTPQGEQDFIKPEDQVATGVRLIDYGASAYNIYGFKNYYKGVPFQDTLSQTDSCIRYFNDFYADGQLKQNISRSGMVFCAKNSEEMRQYVSPTEIAETLGNINIGEVKSDVENNLGIKIDNYLTDTLSASFDDLAENLVK